MRTTLKILKYEFHDKTYDKGAPVNPDACAIMLIPAAARAAVQMMGYAGNANVWHWLADREALVLDAQAKGDVSVKAVRGADRNRSGDADSASRYCTDS